VSLQGSPGVQKISTGYVPRKLQAELHQKLKRFNVLVCHRRFGKTVFAINEKLDRGLRNPLKNPRYAYIAPLYGQAKRVAWDYLKMYTEKIPGATPNEADLRVDIPRPALGDTVRFTLLGADNPVSLKGIYLDGVTMDEYAEMNPATWREVIRPTLSDRAGWANFIGTPKGRNSFFDLYEQAKTGEDPEWFARSL
jgi:phage terminase large subunit